MELTIIIIIITVICCSISSGVGAWYYFDVYNITTTPTTSDSTTSNSTTSNSTTPKTTYAPNVCTSYPCHIGFVLDEAAFGTGKILSTDPNQGVFQTALSSASGYKYMGIANPNFTFKSNSFDNSYLISGAGLNGMNCGSINNNADKSDNNHFCGCVNCSTLPNAPARLWAVYQLS